jgi:hypothetical protein
MPRESGGIQYAVTSELNSAGCDYWITRMRG